MRANKLRNLLNENKPSIATHIHSTWPSVVEAIGHTHTFDYIEFVAEYAPYDLYDFDNLCRAAELYDLGMMIKVDYEPKRFVAQRAIGSGFQSVLFADCHNVEEAKACIRSVKPDTPEDHGEYGVGVRRHAYMNYGGGQEYVQALRDTVIVLMIEKKGAVEQLEEILALPGLDMIQWGGADYSMSIGRAGQRHTPEIQAVEKRVLETSIKMGIPPRAEINSPDEAKYYLDLGVRHFCIGTDLLVLYQWMKNNGEALRKVVEGA
ncbi:MAG: aldolase/citrate lyase family protein [Chloroflexi bacterium]|nr:aldolase/citrate lyase family protein [Chloroflexota bacterium]